MDYFDLECNRLLWAERVKSNVRVQCRFCVAEMELYTREPDNATSYTRVSTDICAERTCDFLPRALSLDLQLGRLCRRTEITEQN